MRRRELFLVMVVLVLILTACQAPPAPTITAEEPAIPTPEAGQATITGRVMSKDKKVPLTNTVVRLAEVYWQGDEGAYVLDGAFSPGGYTDENGYFVISSIEAREYVIVVGDVEWIYDIVREPSGKAMIWTANADQILSTGDLLVDLSN